MGEFPALYEFPSFGISSDYCVSAISSCSTPLHSSPTKYPTPPLTLPESSSAKEQFTTMSGTSPTISNSQSQKRESNSPGPGQKRKRISGTTQPPPPQP